MNTDGTNTFDNDKGAQWEVVSGLLRAEIGEAAYQSWLKPMTLRAINDGQVKISVPTRFMRDWIVAHYVDRLCQLWAKENPGIKSVDVYIQSDREAPQTVSKKTAGPEASSAGGHVSNGVTVNKARNDISGPLDQRFTFENFVVGKTHLMHAIAWHIQKSTPDRSVIYLSAEKFMYRFIRALREKNTVDFKDQFRSVDVLMIDDVQFISGKDSTQEEFFHTFNSLVDKGHQIVISSDKSPSDLEGMEERLISRLNCGLVADIHATTYELRLGILQSKAENLGVKIPPKVLEFLAHKITANVRELEGGLNRVVAHAQLVGREISLEATQDVLHDLLRANDRRVTIEEIQKRVAAHFNIRTSDMHSARRARSVARPRQVAMYLAKQLTARSLPEIGRKFGGRDHTTVMHAVKRVDELRELDMSFAEDVELLRRMLEG